MSFKRLSAIAVFGFAVLGSRPDVWAGAIQLDTPCGHTGTVGAGPGQQIAVAGYASNDTQPCDNILVTIEPFDNVENVPPTQTANPNWPTDAGSGSGSGRFNCTIIVPPQPNGSSRYYKVYVIPRQGTQQKGTAKWFRISSHASG